MTVQLKATYLPNQRIILNVRTRDSVDDSNINYKKDTQVLENLKLPWQRGASLQVDTS